MKMIINKYLCENVFVPTLSKTAHTLITVHWVEPMNMCVTRSRKPMLK